MKNFTSKLLILIVFFLMGAVMVQSADAMGQRPGRDGFGSSQSAPEPAILSLLGAGIVGIGVYLISGKNKDK